MGEKIKNLFRQPEKYLDKKIDVSGWIKTVRNSKDFSLAVQQKPQHRFFKNIVAKTLPGTSY